MTGYGRSQGWVSGRHVTVEIRCVNHRYQDIRLSLPRGWMALEVLCEKLIRKTISRGRIECTVSAASGAVSVGTPVLDMDNAREYLRLYRELARELWKKVGSEEEPSLAMIAKAEGVITLGTKLEDIDEGWRTLSILLKEGLDAVERMRQEEGKELHKAIASHINKACEILGELEKIVPREQELQKQRAHHRINTLMGAVPLNEDRLVQEMAQLAERMDVTEELSRLHSHFGQIRKQMEEKKPVGREMDFLLQELAREINTVLSKMHATEVVSIGVGLKAEIEKCREQVQNVE